MPIGCVTNVIMEAAILTHLPKVDLANRDHVARAYEATEVFAPSRVPIASIVAAIIALTAATAVAAAAVFVVTDPRHGVYTAPPPPEPIGAYHDGGEPVRDLAIEQVLAIDLTGLVVANDGAAAGSPDNRARRSRNSPTRSPTPPARWPMPSPTSSCSTAPTHR